MKMDMDRFVPYGFLRACDIAFHAFRNGGRFRGGLRVKMPFGIELLAIRGLVRRAPAEQIADKRRTDLKLFENAMRTFSAGERGSSTDKKARPGCSLALLG